MILVIIFLIFSFPSVIALDIDWNPQTYSITDGDSLKRNYVRYRLEGMDAPEINQICTLNNKDWECGLAAALYLEQLHGKNGFECKNLGQDRYKRILARCYILEDGNRIDIGSLMVREGYALAYRHYSKDYIDEEEFAKENSRGLWRSMFMKPWEWRRTKSNKK
jgi:endonuclease YncB( thermonuclease family)